MSIQRRQTIVRGPAIVRLLYRTAPTSGDTPVEHTYTFRTKDDVVFKPETKVFDVPSSELGRIDQRASELLNTAEFTPVGTVNADGVALLWPHLAKLPGESIFGDYDTECEIIPVAGGRGVRLWNVAVAKMPDIFLSATKTQIGQVQLRGIIDDGYDWGDSMHVNIGDEEEAQYDPPELAAISPSSIPTTTPVVSWGSSMDDIKTADGVTISFDLQTQDESEDGVGVYDITVVDLKATAKFTPVAGFDLDELNDILHNADGRHRGGSVRRDDLRAKSRAVGGLDVTVFNASLLSAPLTYGATAKRFGELSFEGMRGTGNAVATVAIVTQHHWHPRAKTAAAGTSSAEPAATTEPEGEGGQTESP